MQWLQIQAYALSFLAKPVFALTFVLVIAPMGLIQRLVGRDPLARRQWKERETMFVQRARPFARADFERM